MAGYLAAEHLNSDGEPEVPKKSRSTGTRRTRRRVAKKARLEVEAEESEGGSHDCDFVSISSDSDSQSSTSGSGDDELPVLTNAEVRSSLHVTLAQEVDILLSSLPTFFLPRQSLKLAVVLRSANGIVM